MFSRLGQSLRAAVPRIRLLGVREASDLFQPPYLEAMRPKVPIYEYLNFQIKSYDFAVLEKYQSFLHRTAVEMSIDVEDSWATPAQHWEVTKLKTNTDTVEDQFKLSIYERTIQFYNFPAHLYPVYLRLVQAGLPEGVTLSVAEHEDAVDEIRFVPDTQLKELQTELSDLYSGKTKRSIGFRKKKSTDSTKKE